MQNNQIIHHDPAFYGGAANDAKESPSKETRSQMTPEVSTLFQGKRCNTSSSLPFLISQVPIQETLKVQFQLIQVCPQCVNDKNIKGFHEVGTAVNHGILIAVCF